MPVLPDPRHELFSQYLAAGKTADASYAEAGFCKNRHNAAALARKQHILTRVSELQEARLRADAEATVMATKALSIDKQWLIEKAEEARLMAMENKQSSAAIAAVKELGILSGFRVEKRENAFRSEHDLSDAELMEIAAGGRSRMQ